jgi:hypothetical protein
VWGASLSPVADVEHVSWDSDPTNERTRDIVALDEEVLAGKGVR